MPVLVTILSLTVVSALIILAGVMSQKEKKKVPVYNDKSNLGGNGTLPTDVSVTNETSVSINLPDCTVVLGTVLNVTANVTPAGANVSWFSSNPDTLYVDGTGKVIATGRGIATLTASVGNQTDSVIIECVETGEQPILGFAFYQNTEAIVPESGEQGTDATVENITTAAEEKTIGATEKPTEKASENVTKATENPQTMPTTVNPVTPTSESAKAPLSSITSSQMPTYLTECGFRKHSEGTYVYEKDSNYYGEVLMDGEKTHFYILQNQTDSDQATVQAIAKLLPQSAQMVWNTAMQATSDTSLTVDGRTVRIVVPQTGGHKQIVIFN